MRLVNTKADYGLAAIALHWVMAVMVLGMFTLGLYMTGLEYMDPWYDPAPYIHKSIGICVFTLLVLRTFWRLVNVKPDPLPGPLWELKAATLVHRAFYFLLFGVTMSGYLISTADGRGIEVFGWFEVPAIIHDIEGQEDAAGAVHLVLASSTIALAGLHALAALKHHFVDGDKTLLRMLGVNTKKVS